MTGTVSRWCGGRKETWLELEYSQYLFIVVGDGRDMGRCGDDKQIGRGNVKIKHFLISSAFSVFNPRPCLMRYLDVTRRFKENDTFKKRGTAFYSVHWRS